MNTKFGERKRPDFEIVDWRTLDGQPAIASAPVVALTAGEIVDDSINY